MIAIILPVIIASTKIILSRISEATLVLIAIPVLVSRLYSKIIVSSIIYYCHVPRFGLAVRDLRLFAAKGS